MLVHRTMVENSDSTIADDLGIVIIFQLSYPWFEVLRLIPFGWVDRPEGQRGVGRSRAGREEGVTTSSCFLQECEATIL